MVDIQSSHQAILWHNHIGVNGIEIMTSIRQKLGFGQYSPIVKIPARNHEQGSFEFNLFKSQKLPYTLTFWTPKPTSNLFWMSANIPLQISLALAVILEGQAPKSYSEMVSRTIPQYIRNFAFGATTFKYEWAVLYVGNSSNSPLRDAVRSLKSEMVFHLFDYDLSDIHQLSQDLLNHIQVFNDIDVDDDLQRLSVPKMPSLTVAINEIGVAENVALNYANSLIKGLISTEIAFTVWIYKATESITFDDAIITQVGENYANQKTVFHIAIEIQGYVYDCYKGFNGDISLADFQNRITSDTRDQITVSSGLKDFEEIEKQISNLIRSE